MIDRTTFTGGLNLNFFAEAEFESIATVPYENQPLIVARNALRFLMMGWSSSWTELISWPIFKAIYIQRDPTLVRAMRLAFQQGFEHLFNYLSPLELNEQQKEQVQLYLSNCINLLPYSDLTPYESIKIPQLIGNKWELIDYYVTPIELTSQEGINGYFIKDHDRVFAYGLQAINNERAQTHLIFMGTTYPAGQGFVPQVDSDLRAFDSVGNSLYQSGREKILQWLAEQKQKIHVCGVSLGGALSLLFALDQGEHIDRVDALNPPGLAENWGENPYDRWDSLTNKPQVVIQQQADDPVSIFGEWKNDWQIIQVTPPKDKKGPNAFCDHFLNYAGFAETTFSYVSAEEENKKRKYRNLFIFSLGRGALYYSAIWPYNFLLRPSIYFLYEQSLKRNFLSALGISIGIVLLLTALSLPPLYIAVSSLLAGVLSYNFILPWFFTSNVTSNKDDKAKKAGFAHLHDPRLPRNPELDIYNPDNAIEQEVSYGDLNTYYRVMRCLVKNKDFSPVEDKPYKHHTALSKKAVLQHSEDPEFKNNLIPLHLSKAKAITIKRTLALVDKLGLDNSSELKKEVEQEYQRYCLGK
ncbi:hypothetical protein [Legionella sp. km772]|uniref:hypothetical protein n=1 Tax=Legionella sp. km772 TaxID=2498111 RepID=UPI000F8CCDE3|nr:hypothetical protein [Legionella sp. km772]RUR11132.1 hypothetical protein ELY15_07410 [Legionella sp. km772]